MRQDKKQLRAPVEKRRESPKKWVQAAKKMIINRCHMYLNIYPYTYPYLYSSNSILREDFLEKGDQPLEIIKVHLGQKSAQTLLMVGGTSHLYPTRVRL